MGELDGLGDLPRNRQGFFYGNRPLCEALGKGRSFHQFEDEGSILYSVDGSDIWMIEGGQDLGLPGEARQAIRVPRQGVRKDFDGDLASQLGVSGPVNRAHAAFPELSSNPVVSDTGLRDHRLAA